MLVMDPPTTLHTPEDLLNPPDSKLYELIDGQLVEKPVSVKSIWVATNLACELQMIVKPAGLGWVLVATAHAWEDWAETWAHYLHMTDTLETAATCGVSLAPRRADEPQLNSVPDPVTSDVSFDHLMDSWRPLTYMLNNLNRGLGVRDAYPFVLSTPVVEKLRFVHDLINAG